MKKKITINEAELRNIIREEIVKVFTEDITINRKDGKRTISVTSDNTMPKYVDTNNHVHPYVFKDKQRGYTICSIFQRQQTEDKTTDANPLFNALKQRKGWEFENAKKRLNNSFAKFCGRYQIIANV